MKKNFNTYAICWAILLVVFNAVVFLARPIIPNFVFVYDTRFWISWVLVIASFVGNLICARKAFKAESLNKFFYSVSLISISYIGVILTLIFGAGLMLIPDCPAWIAGIVSVVILALNVIAILKACAAVEIVEGVDKKVKDQTIFIKSLTVDAESLLAHATTPEAKEACKKVYEALRYSDPMSNNSLAGIESQITQKFNELSSDVSNSIGGFETIADELVLLISDRNKKCRLIK